MNAQLLFFKRRVRQLIRIRSLSNELPHSLFRSVAIRNSARLVNFKTIKKTRHRLLNDAGILRKSCERLSRLSSSPRSPAMSDCANEEIAIWASMPIFILAAHSH
jgi:hypothetical protein